MTATTAPVTALPTVAASHLERASALASRGQRTLLGLVGAPGAGKSTLADVLLHHLGSRAQGVPMDGFHLANRELDRLGRRQRKGAPDTFDSAGFAALLRRLRQQDADTGEVVYAPAFTRDLDEPVAGAIPIFSDTPLVIVEGNYLLLEDGHWQSVATLLDEVWYVDVDRCSARSSSSPAMCSLAAHPRPPPTGPRRPTSPTPCASPPPATEHT